MKYLAVTSCVESCSTLSYENLTARASEVADNFSRFIQNGKCQGAYLSGDLKHIISIWTAPAAEEVAAAISTTAYFPYYQIEIAPLINLIKDDVVEGTIQLTDVLEAKPEYENELVGSLNG